MSKRFIFSAAPQRSPEWFEIRKGGITATGITAINGTSPYKTAYRLWAELTGQVGEQVAGAAAQRGQLLEQAVADFYTLETGAKLRKSNGIVRLKEHPWAMASLDRTIIGDPEGLVEIKTSTSNRWALFPVPPEYVDQVQWQMFVTGAKYADVAVLLSGLVFRIERVEADPVYQTMLFDKAVAFRELVASGTPPPLTGNDSDTLAEVKPQSSNTYAKADPQLDHIARLYIEAKVEAEAADASLKEMAIAIKEAIGEGEGVKGRGWLATWKTNKSSTKTDWHQVALALRHRYMQIDDVLSELGVANEWDKIVEMSTEEKPGARVFRVHGKEDEA
jgi:putative phage-type endonuclease